MSRTYNNVADISWIDPKKPMVAISFDDGPVDPVSETSSAIRIQNAIFMEPILKEISGREQFLLRPPYLSVDQVVKDTIDVPLISCGLDSEDWNKATAQQMIDKITKACENGSLDGLVVLMHETYDATAEAVEYLAPYLKEQGYQIVTVSEMFKARGAQLEAGVVYGACPKA